MAASTTATHADLGPAFREARIGAGLSLRALAAEAGVSHAHLSRWERGERVLSEVNYQHITHTLADYLAGKWSA